MALPNGDGDFSNAPNFNWNDGGLLLIENRVDYVNDDFGSASCAAPVSAPLSLSQ